MAVKARNKRARAAVVAVVCVAVAVIFLALPGPKSLAYAPFSLVVQARDGTLLGARTAADGQWRFPLSDSVPHTFARAIVTREDKRFWRHPGIDPLAFFRACMQNLRAGRVKSGGSTITMQVIRLSRSKKRRSITEKIIEMTLALRLELFNSKKEVLALYAGHAPFGSNVVGLVAASWRYFGRPPDMLSWAEAATLAVLPNEPGLVHPGRNRRRLHNKRDKLLTKLCTAGIIDSSELRLSLAEPLTPSVHPLPRLAPHLFDRIAMDRAGISFGSGGKRRHAGPVRSTIDAALQKKVLDLVQRHAQQLRRNGIYNIAALVVSVKSGEVIAYIGNASGGMNDSAYGCQVDCIRAPRSTGSVLKPFLYAAMLDNGDILPSTLVPDVPTSIGGFTPQNFNREYEGAVPAAMALARSLNIPAVHMLIRFGISRFHHTLATLGMTTLCRNPDEYGISLILGGAEGTLWDLTGIYASIARKVNAYTDPAAGKEHGAAFIPVYIRNEKGAVSVSNKDIPFSPGACYCMLDAMLEVTRPGDEMAWKEFHSSRRVAWKTGTSFGFRDAWAIGVTPEYAVGIWAGNASGEGRPGLIGIEVAGPVLFDIFNTLPHTQWFEKPESDLRRVAVCNKSGYVSGRFCTQTDTILAPVNSPVSSVCPYHQLVHLDRGGQYRVTDACERVDAMLHKPWFVLPPLIETFYRKRHADYASLPPMHPGCAQVDAVNPVGLIYPQISTTVFVPREITGESGRVVFQAAHRDPDATIHWHLDEYYLGSTKTIHEMAANPSPGKHRLVLVDDAGNRVEREIRVAGREELVE